MFNWLRRAYYRIPNYGQLIARKCVIGHGWYKDAEEDVGLYYSLMLRGRRRGLFNSGRFYIVLTKHCVDEAIERGKKNLKYTEHSLPFGEYTGIQEIHADRQGNFPPRTFECVIMNTYQYARGGKVKDFVLVLSERQFRRAIARAKTHGEIVVKHKITDPVVRFLFRILRLKKD